jgi:STE24 endopeptidase
MSSTFFFTVILCLVVANFLWSQLLAWLNRSRMSAVIPDELKGFYAEDEYARQQAYQKTNSRFGLISGSFSFAVTMAVLVFGVFGRLDDELRVFTEHFLLLPLVFFAIIFFVDRVIDLPFDWYAVFRIEESFGFNKTTRRTFVADFFKGLALSAVIGGAVMTGVIAIWHCTGHWFALLAWAAVSLFSLVMTFFYSEWIVPLFNKQKPLEDGDLRTAIQQFADRANFRLSNIYVIDGSKRSTKANAYFTGFGRKKRIVLYDTLANDLTTNEIVAVLAHEIGHYRKRHIVQSLVISLLTTGFMLFILSLFLNNQALAEALGGRQASFHLGIIGFSLLFAPVSELLDLASNCLSRRNEYQADDFAASFGLAEPLTSALKKISVKSLSNLNPHPLVVFWRYSHPTLLQRIKNLQKHNELQKKSSY